MKYRSRSVEIEGMQFNESCKDMVHNWAFQIQNNVYPGRDVCGKPALIVPTPNGEITCPFDYYLIVDSFSVSWCKLMVYDPLVFQELYEPVGVSNTKWRIKEPFEIEAIQFTGENFFEINRFVGLRLVGETPPKFRRESEAFPDSAFWIDFPTLHGEMRAVRGDWIIKTPNGIFPCKPDVFKNVYEIVF